MSSNRPVLTEEESGRKLIAFRDRAVSGGARRDRTDDLLLAKQALSQLSFGPGSGQYTPPQNREMVGPGRLELPTSRLSGVRSNHLSYGPPVPQWSSGTQAEG